jgi:2-polyprenyl-3-methyl-5-hydroxy-6-metoxy-1,4-benzoquinol methylase
VNKIQSAGFVWRFLSPLPVIWRLHQVGRSFLSPLIAVLNHVPRTSQPDRAPVLVDLGCGHGIFLALAKHERPDLDLIGIDLSESKIASARKAFEAAGLDASRLAVKDIADFDPGSADAITILDVLYLVPIDQWDGILDKCYAALKPSGALLVKEMNRNKKFKFQVLCLEETLAVKVLHLTTGNNFTFPPPGEIRARLEKAGFTVEQIPLDRGYHVPHMLWIARKPAS